MAKEIYRVTVVRAASMYCLAKDPEDAMRVAEMFANELDDEDFEDAGNDVDSCETYSTDIEDIDEDEMIYTEDGPIEQSVMVDILAEDEDGDWRDSIEWQDSEWLFSQNELKEQEVKK